MTQREFGGCKFCGGHGLGWGAEKVEFAESSEAATSWWMGGFVFIAGCSSMSSLLLSVLAVGRETGVPKMVGVGVAKRQAASGLARGSR